MFRQQVMRYIVLTAFCTLCIQPAVWSQVGIGLNMGYSRGFNETIPEPAKNNVIFGVKFEYYNSSLFQPMLDIDYTTLPVQRSWIAGGDFEGSFALRYRIINVGISTMIRLTENETSHSGIVPGFGISYSNAGVFKFYGRYIGIASDQNFNTRTENALLKPFVSLAYLGQRTLYKNIDLQVQIGALYYVKNDPILARYEYSDQFNNSYVIYVNDRFQSFRPYFKVGAVWKFGKPSDGSMMQGE